MTRAAQQASGGFVHERPMWTGGSSFSAFFVVEGPVFAGVLALCPEGLSLAPTNE